MQFFRRDSRIYISNPTLSELVRLEKIAPLGQAASAAPGRVESYYTLPDNMAFRKAVVSVANETIAQFKVA